MQLVDAGVSTSRNVGYDQRSGAQNENLVVFRAGWCSQVAEGGYNDPCWDVDPFASPAALGETCANKYNCFEDPQPADRATIAITTVTHDPRSGRIHDADIELADWTGQPGPLNSSQPPEGWYFTCTDDTSTPCASYGQDGCAYIDLQSNATHEVGHFIGLAHPCAINDTDCGLNSPYRNVVMFPSARLRDTSKRVLTADDREGLCTIYPLGGPTSTCAAQRKRQRGLWLGGRGVRDPLGAPRARRRSRGALAHERARARAWPGFRPRARDAIEPLVQTTAIPAYPTTESSSPLTSPEWPYRTSSARVAPMSRAATSMTVVGMIPHIEMSSACTTS